MGQYWHWISPILTKPRHDHDIGKTESPAEASYIGEELPVKSRFLSILLIFLAGTVPGFADNRYIVRTTGGTGALQGLCNVIGCTSLIGLSDPKSQVYLLTTNRLLMPVDFLLELLLDIAGITHIEADLPTNVLYGPGSLPQRLQAPAGLLDTQPVEYYGGIAWKGYTTQPAVEAIDMDQEHNAFQRKGAGIVGVIDTGIDPFHPALIGAVVPGYDFTRNQAGYAAETADLNQSTAAVVDQAEPVQVNSTTIAQLDQSTAAVVDNPAYAAFGHGTMVSGIVHLVAPNAFIMPLKAFHADGSGYLSDILRAIYYGVQSNARVLNMSFSMSGDSAELKSALDYAVSQQVTCVAAAGNNGNETIIYPAGFDNTMGVGSTNLMGQRSTFSNYGNNLVWVAAPGEGIISTYPMATYAAGWGTSFSTPFVSGTAALLLASHPSTDEATAARAIANAKWIGQQMGNGLLDVDRALGSDH
jgi:subtilisin family serine protease